MEQEKRMLEAIEVSFKAAVKGVKKNHFQYISISKDTKFIFLGSK